MNFLNSESFKKHMSAEHNYLEDLKNQGVIDCESEDSTPAVESEFTEPNLVVVEKNGIGTRNANVPDFLRQVIGTVANTSNERQIDIANAFGVSRPLVSNAKHGMTNSRTIIPELRQHTNELKAAEKSNRELIENEALMRTLSTLKILTEDDIECLGAKDKADVAVKLSKVAANMRDKVVNNDNRTLLIIKAPPVKESLYYDTIQV